MLPQGSGAPGQRSSGTDHTMSFRFSASRLIDAAADDVFSTLTDIAHLPGQAVTQQVGHALKAAVFVVFPGCSLG